MLNEFSSMKFNRHFSLSGGNRHLHFSEYYQQLLKFLILYVDIFILYKIYANINKNFCGGTFFHLP